MKIVCIGSGNLATNLTLAWKEAGILVEQVFSRTEANARALAERLGCAWTSSTGEIINDADLYLFSLKGFSAGDGRLEASGEQRALGPHGRQHATCRLRAFRHTPGCLVSAANVQQGPPDRLG